MADDPPDDNAAALDELERQFDRLARATRRLIVVQLAMLSLVMLADLAMVWFGGGRFMWRDCWIVLGLTFVGVMVCATRATDWHYSRQRDARELGLLRLLDQVATVRLHIGVVSIETEDAPTVH